MKLWAALKDFQSELRPELFFLSSTLWKQMFREMKSRKYLQNAFVAIVWSAYYGELFKDGVTPCPLCWTDAIGNQSAVSGNTAEKCSIQWEVSEQYYNKIMHTTFPVKEMGLIYKKMKLWRNLEIETPAEDDINFNLWWSTIFGVAQCWLSDHMLPYLIKAPTQCHSLCYNMNMLYLHRMKGLLSNKDGC